MQKGIFTGLLACASALALSGCGESQPPAPPPPAVGVTTVSTQSVPLVNELPGRVAALETAEVRPQINGVIRRSLFSQGGYVRAGQVLFEIEDSPYRAALAQAQGHLLLVKALPLSSKPEGNSYVPKSWPSRRPGKWPYLGPIYPGYRP